MNKRVIFSFFLVGLFVFSFNVVGAVKYKICDERYEDCIISTSLTGTTHFRTFGKGNGGTLSSVRFNDVKILKARGCNNNNAGSCSQSALTSLLFTGSDGKSYYPGGSYRDINFLTGVNTLRIQSDSDCDIFGCECDGVYVHSYFSYNAGRKEFYITSINDENLRKACSITTFGGTASATTNPFFYGNRNDLIDITKKISVVELPAGASELNPSCGIWFDGSLMSGGEGIGFSNDFRAVEPYTANEAFDEVLADSNGWSTAQLSFSSNNWIIMDLGISQTFDGIRLHRRWNSQYPQGITPTDFSVDVSDNPSGPWTNVLTKNGVTIPPVGEWYVGSFSEVTKRYVRLTATTVPLPDNPNRYAVQLGEMQVGSGINQCLSGGVSSPSLSCSPNDIILKLSANANAYGEIYNGAGNYNQEICYSKIFGKHYVPATGVDVHACTGNANKVVGLFGTTNAHAEVPGQSNYATNVCYGDLVCVARDNSCVVGETEVLRLSGNTNAHLALTGTIDYTKLICCSSAFSGGGIITDIFWSQNNPDPVAGAGGTEIIKVSGENNYCVGLGTTVKLVAVGGADGSVVKFEIFEDDGLTLDDEIRTVSLGNALTATFVNGIASAQWTITQEDLDKTNDFSDFYFKVVDGDESDRIVVKEESCPNSNSPVAVISNPRHKGAYFIGTNINLQHNSYDSDGTISEAKWTILNKNGVEKEFSEASPNYLLSTPGQKTIKLKVKDNNGIWDEDEISIVGIASPGAIAFINDPYQGQVVKSDGWEVSYSAEDSFVINSTFDTVTCFGSANCVAGICPQFIYGPPSGKCRDLNANPVPIPPGDGKFTNVKFSWEFDDGEKKENVDFVKGVKKYISTSSLENDKTIKVEIKYDYTEAGTQKTLSETNLRSFTLVGNNYCVADNFKATLIYREGSGQIVSVNVFDRPDACSVVGFTNLANSSGVCCPIGYECSTEDDDGNGIINGCIPTEISSCAEYTNEVDCNKDFTVNGSGVYKNHIKQKAIVGGEKCGEVNSKRQLVGCKCSWVLGDASNLGKCGIETYYVNSFEDINCDNGVCSAGSCSNPQLQNTCVYTSDVVDTCDATGQKLITQTGQLQSSSVAFCLPVGEFVGCVTDAKSFPVPCGGRSKAILPFFDWKNFVFALVGVLFIYFILYSNRKKKLFPDFMSNYSKAQEIQTK